MSVQLKQAVAHIKSGDKKAGKAILMSLLKQDPSNSRAWLYMSAVVDAPDKKRKCLEEAIVHNPGNETARNALAKVNQKCPSPSLNLETAVAEDEDEEMWLPDSFKIGSTAGEILFEEPNQMPAQPPVNQTATADRQRKEAIWESLIVRGLAAYRRPNEIATDLANKGMDYNQAIGFVLYVSRKKKRAIALRRMPIVLFIGGLTFIFGLYLLFSPQFFIYGLAMVVSAFVGMSALLKEVFSRSES